MSKEIKKREERRKMRERAAIEDLPSMEIF